MDIAGLQAFVSVSENASFSAAADALHLTQPAVSKRIASLEAELNNRLFDRLGRKIQLTEAGRALLPRAQNIINEVQDSQRAISNLSSSVTGQLHIGTSHHIGLHRLPPVLRNYNQSFPDVELDMQFLDSELACKAVLHGELELGIVTLPPDNTDPLTLIPLWNDPLHIVTSKDHPLTTETNIQLQSLADHPAILPARGTFTREVIEEMLQPADIKLQVRLSTNYLETIRMMVEIGLGWSVLPETMIHSELCSIEVKGVNLSRQLGIVHHSDRTLSNAAQAMCDLLIQMADRAQTTK
ncbi:MAG: LysR family transcriptional regulator [Sulfuriflexus sp.]|nr:LysR family transcriptional regulator [Sulfuriflexus sp.]